MSFSPNTKDGEICPARALKIEEALTGEIKSPDKAYRIVSGYAIKISNIDVNPKANITQIQSNRGYYFTINDVNSNIEKIIISASVTCQVKGNIIKRSVYRYENGKFELIKVLDDIPEK